MKVAHLASSPFPTLIVGKLMRWWWNYNEEYIGDYKEHYNENYDEKYNQNYNENYNQNYNQKLMKRWNYNEKA